MIINGLIILRGLLDFLNCLQTKANQMLISKYLTVYQLLYISLCSFAMETNYLFFFKEITLVFLLPIPITIFIFSISLVIVLL